MELNLCDFFSGVALHTATQQEPQPSFVSFPIWCLFLPMFVM